VLGLNWAWFQTLDAVESDSPNPSTSKAECDVNTGSKSQKKRSKPLKDERYVTSMISEFFGPFFNDILKLLIVRDVPRRKSSL